jgi:CYTH domain-containing protein/mannose-6-phosphate isomerase-like protein (cupin superfamily)
VEIERKWLVHGADATWLEEHFPPERIANVYIAVEGKTQLRVRQRDDAYTLTVKGKPNPALLAAVPSAASVARTEVEFPITAEQFGALVAIAARPRAIRKTRRAIPLGDGLSAELDIFDGMCMVEVEFPSIAEAARFCPPVWFGPEVTDDPAFGNKELALHLKSPEFSDHLERTWAGFTPYMIAERAREVMRRRLPITPSGRVRYVSQRRPRDSPEHYREGGFIAFVGDETVHVLQSQLAKHKHPGVSETFEVVAGMARVMISDEERTALVGPATSFTAEAGQWHSLCVSEYAEPWDPYFYGAFVLRGVPKAKAAVYAPGAAPHTTTLFELDD